jgi:hypothetical protein
VRFFAGDAVLDEYFGNFINSNDALRIQTYFMTGGSAGWINRLPWTFWKANEKINANPSASPDLIYPTITVDPGDESVTQNFYALATGDFNMSYVPSSSKSFSESLTLNPGKTIQVQPGAEFDLPVYAAMNMDVGAVSLILDYPSDLVEVLGVYLGSDPSATVWHTLAANELRIGWYDMLPIMLSNGDALVTLKLKINEEGYEGEVIQFSLAADPLNELADGGYDVIGNASLTMDMVETVITSIDDSMLTGALPFANHPNPFMTSTTFTYDLPADGKVTIDVYSSTGDYVTRLVEEVQNAGRYTLTLDNNTLKPGAYAARLILQTERKVYTGTITIIRHQ